MDRIIEINVKDIGILDLNTKNFAIPLVYNINDIKSVGTRRGSYSKTINIIGSKNNNEIFNNLYEIRGINFTYKFRNKYECSLSVNKIPIFNGFIQLKKITKVLINSTYEIVYEINLFDNVKNLFTNLDEKLLSDLDFSSSFGFHNSNYIIGDHEANGDIVGNLLSTPVNYENVYNYPYIDHYNRSGRQPLSSGLIFPSVYLKAVVDKIFNESDFDYDSDLLDGVSYDGMYEKMVNVYNRENRFLDTKLQSYGFGWADWLDPLINDKNYFNNRELITIDGLTYYAPNITDTYYNYNYTLGALRGFKVQESGTYAINYVLEMLNENIGPFIDHGSVEYQLNDYSMSYVGFDIIDEDGNIEPLQIDDVDITITPFDTNENYLEEEPSYISGSTSGVINVELKEGDNIIMYLKPGFGNVLEIDDGQSITTTEIPFAKQSRWKFYVDLEYKYENRIENIEIGDILPDITQSEFIKEHIKMFNLYLYNDKFETGLIHIEPYKDFYAKGVTLNWSDKVDYSKKITIESSISSLSKIINFTHQKGSDYYSIRENGTIGEVYLYPEGNINNESEVIETEYQSYYYGNNDPFGYYQTINLYGDDRIYDKDDFYSNIDNTNMVFSFIQYNNMFFNGLLGWTKDNIVNNDIRYITTCNNITTIGGKEYDIFYEGDNGLYENFWKEYMDNLIDDDARKVTMYVKLEINDIINLDLRNKILIDGQVYILEKLEYDPSNDESSKITLIKEILNEPGTFTPEDLLLLNDSGEFITTNDTDDKIEI